MRRPLYQFNSVIGMPINGYVILVKLVLARLIRGGRWHVKHIMIMIMY
uniref:Uncharacterized protein n=1 Tax=Picea sitchensis TaxID=3332 RepID=A9NJU3_PICSI|nr:unknown [Picea sitchensis]